MEKIDMLMLDKIREEFIKSEVGFSNCPKIYDLNNQDCESYEYKCKDCWEKALKDIVFKGDILKGWQIIKLIDEGTLKKGDKYIRLKCEGPTGDKIGKTTFKVGIDETSPSLESFIKDEFMIKGKEYYTFEEAREKALENTSGFKHLNMLEFHNIHGIMRWLANNCSADSINKMLNEKLWEVE